MASTTVTIRCEEDIKRAATEVAEYYGFDLSSVTRAIWKQMARTKSIPLDLYPYEPNEETLQAIREADEIIAQGGTGQSFSSGREMLDAIINS